MKTSALLACLLANTGAEQMFSMEHGHRTFSMEYNLYMEFCTRYGRNHLTRQEMDKRFDIFAKNLRKINEVNASNSHTHQLGVNEFADWTDEEYQALLGHSPVVGDPSSTETRLVEDVDGIPESVNWVKQNKVIDWVRFQGRCGSCWAISSVSAVEGAVAIKKRQDAVALSVQQVLDCDSGDHGCGGGMIQGAMTYLKANPINKEADYGYEAHTRDCRFKPDKDTVQVSGYQQITKNNVDALKAAIAKGPVAVAIQASSDVFKWYHGGVIQSECCGTNPDHAAVAVGYGKNHDGIDYFLVKNAFGKMWGREGYVKIATKSSKPEGICGILKNPVLPTI